MRHMTPAEARKITERLIREHWDTLAHYKVVFDNARRRAGQCDYRRREISLSKPLMAHRSYEDTMMTITHEIAHAIVGPRHGHDYVWQRMHKSLGGNGKRCYADDGGLAAKTANWIGTCGHGKEFTRYKQPIQMDGYRCNCGGRRSPVVWKRRAFA